MFVFFPLYQKGGLLFKKLTEQIEFQLKSRLQNNAKTR